MATLPVHGRIDCAACFLDPISGFNRSHRTNGVFRLTHNPLAWGNLRAKIVVLGFSKGPNALEAVDREPHDRVAYAKQRKNVGKILRHLRLIPNIHDEDLRAYVDRLIADQSGRFHFGSLVRCSVSRFSAKKKDWALSGNDMLAFIDTDFGDEIVSNCATRILKNLPPETELVIVPLVV